MPPLIFPLNRDFKFPHKWQAGFQPLPIEQLHITGVSRNASGSILANCTVILYQTSNNNMVGSTVSDANGNYSFVTVGPAESYYVVAYLAGSPDVFGTTVNTLTGS